MLSALYSSTRVALHDLQFTVIFIYVMLHYCSHSEASSLGSSTFMPAVFWLAAPHRQKVLTAGGWGCDALQPEHVAHRDYLLFETLVIFNKTVNF